VTDALIQAICSAMDFLSRREHASLELRQKLSRRGFDPDIIDRALIQLRADNLLSDERFVRSFVETKINKGCGLIKIKHELRKRGIDGELLSSSLSMYDEDYWQQHIRQVREKRFGKELPQHYRERAKQVRFLQYRGFTTEQIRQVLNDEWQNED